MHAWFAARPGILPGTLPGILGSLAVEWNEMLPPGPRDVWQADIKAVAAKLATHDGRALV